MELDSDTEDEDEYEDDHDNTVEEDKKDSDAKDDQAGPSDSSPAAVDGAQDGVAPPLEDAEGGGAGGGAEAAEEAERIEPPSPSAHGTAGGKGRQGDGAQPRFAPQRMFMDEVRAGAQMRGFGSELFLRVGNSLAVCGCACVLNL